MVMTDDKVKRIHGGGHGQQEMVITDDKVKKIHAGGHGQQEMVITDDKKHVGGGGHGGNPWAEFDLFYSDIIKQKKGGHANGGEQMIDYLRAKRGGRRHQGGKPHFPKPHGGHSNNGQQEMEF